MRSGLRSKRSAGEEDRARGRRPIGYNDLWIAADARAEDPVLVTRNLGEFKRVPRLRVESWAR